MANNQNQTCCKTSNQKNVSAQNVTSAAQCCKCSYKCLLNKGLAEIIGTFILVFFATGVATFVLISNNGSPALYFDVALAFGLTILVAAYTVGNISGAHLNPAVSLAFFINKKINWKELIVYCVSQFIGAIIASALIVAILAFKNVNTSKLVAIGTNSYDSLGKDLGTQIPSALIVETVLTFFFVLVILVVCGKKYGLGKAAPVAIGVALLLVHLIGIPLTGTSVNPARSFGPALLAAFFGEFEPLKQYWVFLVAPLIGAVGAAYVAKYWIKAE